MMFEEKIWRFMDFTKFVSMLHTKSLFFARSDMFKDQFEGSYPKSFFDHEEDKRKDFEKTDYFTFDPFDSDRKKYNQSIPYSETRKKLREYVVINCWHCSDHESAAMWELYLSTNEGVTIQSHVMELTNCFDEAMKSSLENNYLSTIVPVEYIDFQKDNPEINGISAFALKRKSFEHEKEVRAIIWRNSLGSIEDLSPFPLRA